MPPEEADRVAELMAAFGAASRVRLLYGLVGVERSVEDLASTSGLSPGVVSQQLRVLRLFRMVEGRRDGHRLQGEHVSELLTAVRAHTDHTATTPPEDDSG